MATASLKPLALQDHALMAGAGNFILQMTPSVVATDMPEGMPIVGSSGLAAAPAFTGDNVDEQVITGITTEPYRAAQRLAGAVPLQKTQVGVMPMLGPTVIELNVYNDGDGDADDASAVAQLFTDYAIKKVAHATYGYIYVLDIATATAGLATAKVIGFVDAIGTIYGRVRAVLNPSYRI